MESKKSSSLSRRRVLKAAGAAAVGGGASALLTATGVAAQQGAPSVLTNTQAGRKYRAFVQSSAPLPGVVELTSRALTGRQVMYRAEAAQTCYSSVRQVLVPRQPQSTTQPAAPQRATAVGHGGVGVVVAVGPQVVSTRVGDRVIGILHSACGRCHNCLWGRSDQCLVRGGETTGPIADGPNGMMLYSSSSGMAELITVNEEMTVPVFTDVPSAELSLLTCVGGAGLGMATTNIPVQFGSDVVIFGAGPVGLSALQATKLKGAAKIIVVEPIRYRRELAQKLGATHVLDPNQYKRSPKVRPAGGFGRDSARFDDTLLDHIRDLVAQKTDRVWAGGGRVGPEHVIEAVGGDQVPPKETPGPDPTGITTLMQSWELCSRIGSAISCTIGQPEDAFVQIPGSQFGDSAKHWWVCTAGGTNDRRDFPRYIKLMETGQLNFKALVGKTYPLTQTKQAYQDCADRSVITTVVTPNT
ncbi:MAG: alcohol dehydrogenase catalytic domain-containing protein [Vicinamibacterales bacterium]